MVPDLATVSGRQARKWLVLGLPVLSLVACRLDEERAIATHAAGADSRVGPTDIQDVITRSGGALPTEIADGSTEGFSRLVGELLGASEWKSLGMPQDRDERTAGVLRFPRCSLVSVSCFYNGPLETIKMDFGHPDVVSRYHDTGEKLEFLKDSDVLVSPAASEWGGVKALYASVGYNAARASIIVSGIRAQVLMLGRMETIDAKFRAMARTLFDRVEKDYSRRILPMLEACEHIRPPVTRSVK